MGYKWELRKGSKKEICPQCGQRRFVPYVLASDGETMAGEIYGRCDRENSCGYHLYPSDVKTGEQPMRKIEPKQPLRFYPAAVQTDTHSNLFQFVANLVGEPVARMVWQMYRVGNDYGRTIFWQIDGKGEVRGGKSIPYGTDGRRIKTDKFPAVWLHKCSTWNNWFEGEELQQCYFGEHLLREGCRVALVESEKTALVFAALSPSWTWLAAGGSNNLGDEAKCAALKGHQVLMLPDHGQYYKWRKVALREGWEIDGTLEREPVFDGCDILDAYEAGKFNV